MALHGRLPRRGLCAAPWALAGASASGLLCSYSAPAGIEAVQEASAWSLGRACALRTSGDQSACRWSVDASTPSDEWEVEATLQRGGGAVCAVAWSWDGYGALTGSSDGSASVWRMARIGSSRWELAAALVGHSGAVRALAWSPDGAAALSGASDGTVRMWRQPENTSGASSHRSTWPTTSHLDVAAGSGDVVWAVEWLGTNSTRAVAGSSDRTGCMSGASASAARPSFSSCASGYRAHGTTEQRSSYDRTGRIWAADGARAPARWTAQARLQDRFRHSHLVLGVALSPDGERVLTGSLDGLARVWHAGGVADGIGRDGTAWELIAVLKAHSDAIWSVAWAPDGGRLLTGSADGVTHVWEPEGSGDGQWQVAATLQEIQCFFTANDRVSSVYYGGRDVTGLVVGDLSDWTVAKELTVSSLPGAYLVITAYNHEPRSCSTGAFAISCSNGVSSSTDGWEALGSSENLSSALQAGGGDNWSAPCSSQSNFHLPVAAVWKDARGSRPARKIFASDAAHAAFRIRLATEAARGTAAFGHRVASAVSPAGVAAADFGSRVTSAGAADGTLRELQRQLVVTPASEGVNFVRPGGEEGRPAAAWTAAWAPDGRKLVTGGRDGSASVWYLVAEEPMLWRLGAVLRGHAGEVWSAAWSPDSARLLTGGAGPTPAPAAPRRAPRTMGGRRGEKRPRGGGGAEREGEDEAESLAAELQLPPGLPALQADAVGAALERWASLRPRVEALRPALQQEDRLMQEILDRGLGSEDRKTLRKLASGCGSEADAENQRELLALSTATAPENKRELLAEMDAVIDELRRAQDEVHGQLLAAKGRTDMAAVRVAGRALNDLKALTRRLDGEKRGLNKNSALAALLVTVCRRVLPARQVDPSELGSVPPSHDGYLQILDFYFFSDAGQYCFGEHFSGPNWFTRLKRNMAILAVEDASGRGMYRLRRERRAQDSWGTAGAHLWPPAVHRGRGRARKGVRPAPRRGVQDHRPSRGCARR
ncbi:unnamed protein product [Prorocentrum cordatum]|uniref:Uncharacterized protein n=1 Tax=Prorocentrum cordatum TaxID=2364126 RepID=A0ABN9XTW7_9DINO|nr:unnamed protein product [Polarella glacialis]